MCAERADFCAGAMASDANCITPGNAARQLGPKRTESVRRIIQSRFGAICGIVCCAFPWLVFPAKSAAQTVVTQTVTIQVSPLGNLSSVPASVTLAQPTIPFTSFTKTITISYQARTTPSGGGAITMQVTTDFSAAGSGGPSVANGDLTYTCGAADLGTSCGSSPITASTTTQTNVVQIPSSACTGGGTPCSSTNTNSVTMNLSLADTPALTSGTYTAALTFTISST